MQSYLVSGKMIKVSDLKFSAHLLTLLEQERSNIRLAWIERTISDLDLQKRYRKAR